MYLAPGSAFFHGSETSVGGSADVKINDLFTYVSFQAAVSTLDPDNILIHELEYSPREKSAVEYSEELKSMFLYEDVKNWGTKEDAMDIPSIMLGMCVCIATVGSLVLSDELVIYIAETAVDVVG